MDSSLLHTIFVAAVSFFMLLITIFFLFYRKLRFHKKKIIKVSSLSPSSLTPSPPSFPHNLKHHVFPSFHGADVRKAFLSHILKEFRSKGIQPFIDNNIERSKSIGPELIDAIRGSRIAIILLSRNYASSTWCMNELVEIMKCREVLGQTVMTIFYEVDPTDVKKQTGDFGKVFRKTCKGKAKEDTGRWRQAFTEVAKIAGYHSNNWENEADMIQDISTDVSNKLFNSTPSKDFDGLVGMRAHMKKIEHILRPDLDEVRMIGILGPAGIGKSTIARYLYNRHSNNYQLSVFVENIKARYAVTACSDNHGVKLYLQEQFMSEIFKHQLGVKNPHLGIIKDRLKDTKVFFVLDDVDQLEQLEAMANQTCWFGPWSRIIITTQDQKLLRKHGINHIYKVGFPSSDEALEMFCIYAFGHKCPKNGFRHLAWEVTYLAGKLPLGLQVMGSYFKGMNKHEWSMELPRLRTHLDGKIESILKFSFDALCDEDKALFLHIACFFNDEEVEKVVEHLAKSFLYVRQRLHFLADKSLISIDEGRIKMHSLMAQLGKEIVRKQSVHEPGRRQFLVDKKDIHGVLSDSTTDTRSVIGMDLPYSWPNLNISERAFKGMSNLQFIRLNTFRSVSYISPKLQLLDWEHCPMTCLSFIDNLEFLVELRMKDSKLEKLWDRIKPLRNLKWINLSNSSNLKELPNLSTTPNLKELDLSHCSRLVELPSSIGNTTNLQKLDLFHCKSLVKLPSSIGNARNLQCLNLCGCSSLVELPSSIGNATNLQKLDFIGCSSLVELPASIGNLHQLLELNFFSCSKLEVLPTNINLVSLTKLNLGYCSLFKSFPEISTSIKHLSLTGTSIEEVPSSINLWSRLETLSMPYSENLKEFPYALESITVLRLSNTEVQEIGPWVKGCSRLRELIVENMQKVVSISELPDSLLHLDAANCKSLERLDCSFSNLDIHLNFQNCFKLNQEARNLIVETSTRGKVILPGGQVPAYFTFRSPGSSLTVNLNEKHLRASTKYRACIVLSSKKRCWDRFCLECRITSKQNAGIECTTMIYLNPEPEVAEHLYIFDVKVEEVTSTELDFVFGIDQRHSPNDTWIKECGILPTFEEVAMKRERKRE